MTEADKKRVKEIAIELLSELKKEKLKVEQLWEKAETTAAVYTYVNNLLFESLPYPIYQTDDIDLKTQLVYAHLKHQYYGGGRSIYGAY